MLFSDGHQLGAICLSNEVRLPVKPAPQRLEPSLALIYEL